MATGKQMADLIRRKHLTSILMPAEARRALIEAPLDFHTPTASYVHGSVTHPRMTWGGVFIKQALPTEGNRYHMEFPEDEEWCKAKWEEK